ncbi:MULTISPECIES: hypothetical protein [unclassified Microcoleus]|uniref:hypothetical protein n=1 Tax=unclassified Microcoleus TaxID=2642155 RepID=UPI002FCF4F4F
MTVTFGEFEGVFRCFSVDGARHLVAVRVQAAATLALMSFWGWYCYYRAKVVADCFRQKMDENWCQLWYYVLHYTWSENKVKG